MEEEEQKKKIRRSKKGEAKEKEKRKEKKKTEERLRGRREIRPDLASIYSYPRGPNPSFKAQIPASRPQFLP